MNRKALDIARHSKMVQDASVIELIKAIENQDPFDIPDNIRKVIETPFNDDWVYRTVQQYEMTYGYNLDEWGKLLQSNINNAYNNLLRRLPQSLMNQYNRLMLEAQYDIASGAKTFEEAAKSLIDRLNWEGRVLNVNGRNYRLDKYARLRVRDAMRDAANDSAERVAAEMGTDVYLISSHADARPLCAPEQGKLVGDDSRTIILDGQSVNVVSWGDTSYGLIAGLFGINCRHYKIPVDISGGLYPDWDFNKSPLEEFSKIYK